MVLKQKFESNIIKSHFEVLDNSYELTSRMMYTDTKTYLTDDIFPKYSKEFKLKSIKVCHLISGMIKSMEEGI